MPVRVSSSSAALLRDLFGVEVFRIAVHRLRQHTIHWGRSTPISLQAEAAVVDPVVLETALFSSAQIAEAGEGSIEIQTEAEEGNLVRFGQRSRATAVVTLNPSEPDDQSCMESVYDGWLYLLPSGQGRGVLHAVTPRITDGAGAVRELLNQSQTIRRRVAAIEAGAHTRDVSPSACTKLVDENSVRCGGAAAILDPVCGDGLGNAARTALLAVAVVNGIRDGISVREAETYYRERLRQFLREHLTCALRTYREAKLSEQWRPELEELARGAKKLAKPLPVQPQLGLQGRTLVRSGN